MIVTEPLRSGLPDELREMVWKPTVTSVKRVALKIVMIAASCDSSARQTCPLDVLVGIRMVDCQWSLQDDGNDRR